MIDFSVALDRFFAIISDFEMKPETLPLGQTGGRYLATDVKSVINLPPFNKSAMDGFAIPNGSDPTQPMQIIETVQAGDIPRSVPTPGQCTRIMTGAPVPDNTSQVIPVENTTETGNNMTITRQTSATNICLFGEDVRAGDVIACKGTQLDSLNIPVLISCGIESVDVYRQPRVTVFSTGNELVDRLADWGPGKIFDSNGPMIQLLLKENGLTHSQFHRLSDDPRETCDALENAVQTSDIIMFSGGVSAGKFDFIPDSLRQCGLAIHFDRLKVKPGKPMTFASGRNTLVFGFPGNPVSTWVMFHIFARSALVQLQGQQSTLRIVSLPMSTSWSRRKAVRQEFLPVRITSEATGPTMTTMDYHGSAHLSALQEADGLAIIPAGVSTVSAGDSLEFWPLRWKAFTRRV